MNGNVRRNAKTAFVCVLFIIIVSLFFYLLTAGTMPESVDIPSADKIADVDLSKQGVGIDISSGEYYTGRLYTPDGTILQKAIYRRAIPMINMPHSA